MNNDWITIGQNGSFCIVQSNKNKVNKIKYKIKEK
jgi:hypothetical protein